MQRGTAQVHAFWCCTREAFATTTLPLEESVTLHRPPEAGGLTEHGGRLQQAARDEDAPRAASAAFGRLKTPTCCPDEGLQWSQPAPPPALRFRHPPDNLHEGKALHQTHSFFLKKKQAFNPSSITSGEGARMGPDPKSSSSCVSREEAPFDPPTPRFFKNLCVLGPFFSHPIQQT